MNLTRFLQRPGEPYTHGPTDGARPSVEVWGSKDVSHCPMRAHILLIPQCSWSAIFLYVYTGRIAWNHIRSWDVTSSEKKEFQGGHSQIERNFPQDSGRLNVIPPGDIVFEPCSPQSIYSLADKVCLAALLGGAVANISFA